MTTPQSDQSKIEALSKQVESMRKALTPFGSGVDPINWGKIKAHLPIDLAKQLTKFNVAADKALGF